MGIDAILKGIFQRNWANASLIDVIDILLKSIQLLLLLGGVVAAIFIIQSGTEYLMAFGQEAKAAKGKNGLIAAVTGIIIIVIAFSLVGMVTGMIVKPDKIPQMIKTPPAMN